MKYLFSHRFKRISGWVFYSAIPVGLCLFFMDKFDELWRIHVFSLFSFERVLVTEQTENVIGSIGFRWIENGILDEVLTIVIIVSGLLHCFSRERIEDELIARVRMESLTLSLYINYGLVILSTALIYELTYFYVLVFNLFTILLFFNLIFHYRLLRHYNSVDHEE